MTRQQFKTSCFAITAVNTIASSYYLSYLFFYLRDRYGFGNRENLWVSALHGGIYIFSAWQCGKFAERRGALTSLAFGFAGLTACMVLGAFAASRLGQLLTLAAYSVVLLLTWPALEALTTEQEPPARVPHMVGIYNCTWSAAAAIAYFTGGPLYDALGPVAVFWLPAAMFLGQLIFTRWLARQPITAEDATANEMGAVVHPEASAFSQQVPPAVFLKLAWIASPFAYMAIYTLLAVMPGLATKLGLSPTRVGLFCSVWFFGRFVAFATLWQWTGWHYRFRWLVGSFVVLLVAFAAILLASSLWTVVAAQVVFGLAAGLIYYSSLFYSMDVGDAKAEHGGLHEAAIGLGIFGGPAVAAVSVQLFPAAPHASVTAVSGLLLVGLASLLYVWIRARAAAERLLPKP